MTLILWKLPNLIPTKTQTQTGAVSFWVSRGGLDRRGYFAPAGATGAAGAAGAAAGDGGASLEVIFSPWKIQREMGKYG